ncbi:MAG: type II toxin-antitoxin system Phd/YefM family antitoxin [Planctomycetes bacterium]|nr:type II toxin-antitoxin system Phd/YefM family antitoxin [Planctomycetota bacterium]
MTYIEITEANDPLSVFARRLGREPLVVTAQGKPIAALVPYDEFELELEAASLRKDPRFAATLQRSRDRHEKEGGISPEELDRQIEPGD